MLLLSLPRTMGGFHGVDGTKPTVVGFPGAALIPRQGHLLCRSHHIMTIHVETSDLSTAAVELHEVLGTLGVTQCCIARWFAVDPRSIRRWLRGSRRVPRGAAIVIHLLALEVITIAQVEAAVSIPAARMNGGGSSPEPPALRPVEPAPKQSLADPNLTIAEKI